MSMWYPPWVKEWEESSVPNWTVQQRHVWMREALRLRRKIQAVNYGREELEHYSALLSEFFEHFTIAGTDSLILEILSDGLGDIEPIWHGIKIEQGGVNDIPEWMHEELIKKVQERRNEYAAALPLKTHLEIGTKLLEPSLFKITKTKVQYYSKEFWRDLDDPESPLPLKLVFEKEININWEDIQSIKQFLPALLQEQSYKEMVESIRESLLKLSHDVLWPALFESKSRDGECLSLVLIQASTWQVPGVWNLHACSKTGKISDKTFPASNLIQSAITPPALCLNDALGAMFMRDSTHQQRQNDLRLYRRSKGISSQLRPEQEFYGSEDDDLEIYDRTWSVNPFERYGYIYDLACKRYMGLPQPKDFKDSELLLLNRVLKQAFVALALQTQEPVVAVFILQDTVQLCLRLIEEAEQSGSQGTESVLVPTPEGYQIEARFREWLIELGQRPDKTWSPWMHMGILELIAVTFRSLVLRRNGSLNKETKDWLKWCGHGFRAIVLSRSDLELLLTRDAFREWESSVQAPDPELTKIAQTFSGIEIDQEAIWFITSLLKRGKKT